MILLKIEDHTYVGLERERRLELVARELQREVVVPGQDGFAKREADVPARDRDAPAPFEGLRGIGGRRALAVGTGDCDDGFVALKEPSTDFDFAKDRNSRLAGRKRKPRPKQDGR